MTEWWEALTKLQRIFYYVAIPFTLVLLIQAVLTFIGLGGSDADADGDADADMDADDGFDVDDDFDVDTDVDEPNPGIAGFRFFTVRGIVAFFCIFGWTGVSLVNTSLSTALIIALSVAAGLIAMLIIGLMFYAVKNLQSSGNIRHRNAVGKTAEVYIPIPANRIGKGKVMVTVQERLVEAEAITDEEQKIGTGETVKVIGNMGTTLIVKK